MSLIEPFLDKGYDTFMDNNYYTSVTLFEVLEERKALACGTVRSNRSGLPKEICGVQEKKIKQLKRAESLYRQKGHVTCVTCFSRDTGFFLFFCQIPVAIPDIRFKHDHFHNLISHDPTSICKVHIQDVKTSYTCAICGVIMCPEPCFKRFHTMHDYYFDDSSYNRPRRLKGGKRPFHRSRRRALRIRKLLGSLTSFLNMWNE